MDGSELEPSFLFHVACCVLLALWFQKPPTCMKIKVKQTSSSKVPPGDARKNNLGKDNDKQRSQSPKLSRVNISNQRKADDKTTDEGLDICMVDSANIGFKNF